MAARHASRAPIQDRRPELAAVQVDPAGSGFGDLLEPCERKERSPELQGCFGGFAPMHAYAQINEKGCVSQFFIFVHKFKWVTISKLKSTILQN